MAIKINGTTVIDDSRNYTNIQSITFADASVQTTAGGSGGAVGTALYTGGSLIHTLDNPNPYSTSASDTFARTCDIDGNYAIVAAQTEDDPTGSNSGKVYIYNVATGELLHTLNDANAYNTTNLDFFGADVGISGKYAIVGANGEDELTGSSSGKAYIFDVTTGELLHTLDNPNAYSTPTSDNFGYPVAIDGNYAIVGAYYEDDASGTNSGKAYIFDVTTGNLLHTLDNPNPYSTSANDYFSWSVSISGNYAIVGAYSEDDAGGTESGKAYIFNVTTGALVHTLNNPNDYSTSAGDQFGYSVAINENYAAVGAMAESSATGSFVGRVYVFDVTTGSLVHTLLGTNSYSENFGWSVDLSGDYLIAGEPSHPYYTFSGRVRIFNVVTGELLQVIDNPNGYNTINSDYFGRSLAISGSYAIVGAYNEDDASGTDSGKAYIFAVEDIHNVDSLQNVNFSTNTSTNGLKNLLASAYVGGELIHTLDNPNAYSTSASDRFGFSTSISGNYAISSAYYEGDAGGVASGKAYIFDVTTGSLVHTLDNPNAYSTSIDDNFGYSVSISDKYALAGAPFEDDAGGSGSGKAYIFDVATGKLVYTLDNPNAYNTSANDQFGAVVAIDGKYAIVSAFREDDAGGTTSGKAYIFDATTGTLLHTLDNPTAYSTSANDYFAYSVAISGNYAIAGAFFEGDAGGTTSGKAYIFDVTTGSLVHTLDNPNAYDTSASDYFGTSVGISGNYAIVGANGEDDAGGATSGKAYIFDVTTGSLVHTLDNPNAYDTTANDNFGNATSISGNYAVVGARGEDDAGGTSSGKAYIFDVRTGALLYTLDNPNAYSTSADDLFATGLGISGNYAIVGAYQEDDVGGTTSGKAYIFSVTEQTYLDKLLTMVS